MTLEEAESIVQKYSAYFVEFNEKKSSNGPWVFSSLDLPWSPAKLKYAFYILTEHIAKEGHIEEHIDFIKSMYSTIDGTFKEDADTINQDLTEHFAYVDGLNKADPSYEQKVSAADLKFRANHDGINPDIPDYNIAGEVEIHNFIVDTQA